MEILLGAITFFLAQVIKKTSEKLGNEFTKNGVLLLAFVIVLCFTGMIQAQLISMTTLAFITKVFGMSIATYEVVYKRFLVPVLNRLMQ